MASRVLLEKATATLASDEARKMSKNSLSLLYLLSTTTIITHACLPLTQPFDHVGGSGDGDDDDDDDDDVYAHM